MHIKIISVSLYSKIERETHAKNCPQKMTTINNNPEALKSEILNLLTIPGSHYIHYRNSEGFLFEIRVSDHQGKNKNNSDSYPALSFVSSNKIERGWGYERISDEWLIDETGFCEALSEELEDILQFEIEGRDWSNIYDVEEWKEY